MSAVAVGAAAIGTAGSVYGAKEGGKNAKKAQDAADARAKEAAAYQQMWTQQNRDAAQNINMGNAEWENARARENAQWANEINKANRWDTEAINRQNADYANMINMQNRNTANDMTRGNYDWANQQNQANADRTNATTRDNYNWANQQNIANANLQNQATRGNYEWANQQNIDNAQLANSMNRQNQDYAQQQNWDSVLRGQALNQNTLDQQTAGNRLDSTNAFGGSVTFNPDGSVSQRLGGGDQDLMDTIYGKSNQIMQGMGEGFDVNGDVMNAYRAINQPLVDQQRNQENARLAAMGLATGSGTAWGAAQDALNRNQVNSDQNAILQGFQADQALRASNRADLGAMGSVRSGIQAGLAQPDYWKQGNAALINAPQQQAVNANIAAMNGWGSADIGNMNGWGAAGAGNMSGWGVNIPAYQQANSSIANLSGWQPQIGQASAGQGARYTSDPNIGQAAAQATQNQWNSLGAGAGDIFSSVMGGKNNSGTTPAIDSSAFSKNFAYGEN